MRARASLLAGLAIAMAASIGLAAGEAQAQPFFGRGMAMRVAENGRDRRGEGREEGRGDRRGDRRDYRQGGYAPPAYRQAPAQPPRGYAYPAPAYPYAQRGAPPQAYPAAPPPAYSYAPAPGSRQGRAPLSSVMANISRGTPGRMLDAWQEVGPDGRPAYRVRWAAAGGRRIDFIVDAQTGAIIGQNGY